MRLIVISFYSGVIFVLHSDKEYQLLLSSYSGIAFVLRSNQETTFAYPLTQAQPSSCGQTKKQLLLILLLRHSLRLALGQSSALLILAHAIAVVHASEPLHQ